jgi:hypothetical protein
MTDRDKAVILEVIDNHAKSRKLIAQMMRACIKQLSSRDAKTRCEAIKAMGELADLLEG